MQGHMHAGDYGTNPSIPPNETNSDLDNRSAADVSCRKQDITEVLRQIMTITDQSLDEAQAR